MNEITPALRQMAERGLVGETLDAPPQTDLISIRPAFPIKERRCYLNNASIGALSNPVVAAVNAHLNDDQLNGRNNYPNWCRYADTAVN